MIKIKINCRKNLNEGRSKWRFIETVSSQIAGLVFDKLNRNPIDLIQPGMHSLDISTLPIVRKEPILKKLKNIKIIVKRTASVNYLITGYYTVSATEEGEYEVPENSVAILIFLNQNLKSFWKLKQNFSNFRKDLEFTVEHELIHYMRTNNLFNYKFKHKNAGKSKLTNSEKQYINSYLSYEDEEVETYSTEAVRMAQKKKTNIEQEINNMLQYLDAAMVSRAGRRYYYRIKMAIINYISKRWSLYKDQLEDVRYKTKLNLIKYQQS